MAIVKAPAILSATETPSPQACPMSHIVPAAIVPICAICKKPASLEIAKTDERGQTVHEECYWLKMKMTVVEVATKPKS